MESISPGTPVRRNDGQRRRSAADITARTRKLSEQYGLQLPLPGTGDTPLSKHSWLEKYGTLEQKRADEIVWLIRYLSHQDDEAFKEARRRFKREAEALRQKYGWVFKPMSDEDVVIASDGRTTGYAVPDLSFSHQRQCLRATLLALLKQAREGKQVDLLPGDAPSPATGVRDDLRISRFDSSPIPINFGSSASTKRRSDYPEICNEQSPTKSPRVEVRVSATIPLVNVLNAVDALPTNTQEPKKKTQSRITSHFHRHEAGTMKHFPSPTEMPAPKKAVKSNNTSFTSNASTSANTSFLDSFCATQPSTQPESANTSFTESFYQPPNDKIKMSDVDMYDLDDDEALEAELNHTSATTPNTSSPENNRFSIAIRTPLSSQHNGQAALRAQLDLSFSKFPERYLNLPLCARYEITRVFAHAGVSMDGVELWPEAALVNDYDAFWSHITSLPELQGRPSPMKGPKNVWDVAMNSKSFWMDDKTGFEGILMSMELKWDQSQDGGAFFTVRLKPLQLQLTHRLSRRFGCDRFLEADIADVDHFRLKGEGSDATETKRQGIMNWLVHGEHGFLGLKWGVFAVKDAKKKRFSSGDDLTLFSESGAVIRNQLHFFAVDGFGYTSGSFPQSSEATTGERTRVTTDRMLQWLLHFKSAKNSKQPCLKLFSRISLGLSKTYATSVLKPSQIKYKKHDISSSTGEVMNDGCGQLSRELAFNIARQLRLTHLPSAFQGRIGSAKGVWTVSCTDYTDDIWIEIYPSQLKWHIEAPGAISFAIDEAHRTFEALRWTAPTKPAALPLQFLPILENRAVDKTVMRNAIAHVLINGLTYEIALQKAAMECPQALRKWNKDNQPSVEDRLKDEQVQYYAGMPVAESEKLNLLLDAGFEPKKLKFMADIAFKAYSRKCDTLMARLNINVSRSAYLLMVPDFLGILQPGEVHVGFSASFRDDSSDFNDTMLCNMDILVARSPAHFTSDIQKVRAVFRPELQSLKDVVVFPTTGDFPLAGLLSGGDYDGDIAWCCWEPSIVCQFVNAKQPPPVDLVKLGRITKDTLTMKDLLLQEKQPFEAWLEKSLDFNMRPNLLGVCTNYKEKLQYTLDDVGHRKVVFLSHLVGYLVDAPKQGYYLSEEAWSLIKSVDILEKVNDPQYKRDSYQGLMKLDKMHIIDFLKFSVAKKATDESRAEYAAMLEKSMAWDMDLVARSMWADEEAKSSPEWQQLLSGLREDLKTIREGWLAHFPNGEDAVVLMSEKQKEERDKLSRISFRAAICRVWPEYMNIKPCIDCPLSRSLLLSAESTHADFTPWALLKASLLFRMYTKKNTKFPWWLAGKQLAHLKALKQGMTPVIPSMYAMLKPDATYVKSMGRTEHDPTFWDARAVSVMDYDEDEDVAEVLEVMETNGW